MKRIAGFVAVTVMASGLAFGDSSPAVAKERAVLRFADLGGIQDWRATDDGALLVEGVNGNWYRATFWGPCYELRFTDTIAFVTNPPGDLDKFSSILADGNRCWFRTFEKVEKP